MTKRIAGAPPLLLAVAILVALPAAGRTPTPRDACREEPPAARAACREAADLLVRASRPRGVDLTVRVTARADGLLYCYEPADTPGADGCKAAGTLALPVARRVRLLVTSDDAIYAWPRSAWPPTSSRAASTRSRSTASRPARRSCAAS